MADLKAGLRRDLADEHEAVRTYGQRAQQAKGTPVQRTVTHIRREERDHARKLSGALRTLKRGR